MAPLLFGFYIAKPTFQENIGSMVWRTTRSNFQHAVAGAYLTNTIWEKHSGFLHFSCDAAINLLAMIRHHAV